MERYAINILDKEMFFLYINDLCDQNSWIKPINFGYYKINFFIEVDAKIIINENAFSPKAHDFMSYPLYATHYGLLPKKQNVEYFEFLIPETFFDVLDKDNKMKNLLEKITSRKHFTLPQINQKAFLEKIYGLRNALKENLSNALTLSRVIDILFDIESYSKNQTNLSFLSKNLISIITYVKNNLSVLNTVSDICKALNISRTYVSKLFREEIGCTPYRYLTDVKLEYSISLLKHGKNVTEACYGAGFNSCSVYIETFKKKFSITPYKYQKSLKN